jgi:hypothetical protein
VFQNYHTIANLHYSVRQNNGTDLLAENFYIPLLSYLEEHTKGIIVNEYEIPIVGRLMNKSVY